jgi:hypothetical protein
LCVGGFCRDSNGVWHNYLKQTSIKIKLLNDVLETLWISDGALAVFLRLESCRVLVLVFLVLVGFCFFEEVEILEKILYLA